MASVTDYEKFVDGLCETAVDIARRCRIPGEPVRLPISDDAVRRLRWYRGGMPEVPESPFGGYIDLVMYRSGYYSRVLVRAKRRWREQMTPVLSEMTFVGPEEYSIFRYREWLWSRMPAAKKALGI